MSACAATKVAETRVVGYCGSARSRRRSPCRMRTALDTPGMPILRGHRRRGERSERGRVCLVVLVVDVSGLIDLIRYLLRDAAVRNCSGGCDSGAEVVERGLPIEAGHRIPLQDSSSRLQLGLSLRLRDRRIDDELLSVGEPLRFDARGIRREAARAGEPVDLRLEESVICASRSSACRSATFSSGSGFASGSSTTCSAQRRAGAQAALCEVPRRRRRRSPGWSRDAPSAARDGGRIPRSISPSNKPRRSPVGSARGAGLLPPISRVSEGTPPNPGGGCGRVVGAREECACDFCVRESLYFQSLSTGRSRIDLDAQRRIPTVCRDRSGAQHVTRVL